MKIPGEQPEGTKEWHYQSETRPGMTHTVTLLNEHLYCTCEGFVYRRHCKHVENILQLKEQDMEILGIRKVEQ